MKSPADLASRWARQWQDPDLREARILEKSIWPISLPIGRPTGAEINASWQETADLIRLWRELPIGIVRWESVSYRATGKSIEIPSVWDIRNSEEWISATNEPSIRAEYEELHYILKETDSIFHSILVRERSLWKGKLSDDIIKVAHLVMQLSPGCAGGKPLRALSIAGIDSKFFERYRSLIIRLLDIRYDGEVSRQTLEAFLNAWQDGDHWLLLADLGDQSILTFKQLRVRASELRTTGFDAHSLLLVENESCLHLLPQNIPGFTAILGAGNNLSWLQSAWIQKARIGYWGDIDTWGLTLLARARVYAPNLVPLLMERKVFDLHLQSAVTEKVTASSNAPNNLTPQESDLYYFLLSKEKGRLEQEFLTADYVHPIISAWANNIN